MPSQRRRGAASAAARPLARPLLAGLAMLAACASAAPSNTSAPYQLLLFTATAGYRHDSIPVAADVLTALGNGSLTPAAPQQVDATVSGVRWETTHTEDGSLFEKDGWLQQFDAVAFVLTTDVDPPGVGTVLTPNGAAQLGAYIAGGASYAGIHSAANTLYAYPFYGRTVGSFFTYHAQLQPADIRVLTTSSPSTSTLPSTLNLTEEIYSFRADPRQLPSAATVLLSPVAGTYSDSGSAPNQGSPHPLAWVREGDLLADPSLSSSSSSSASSAFAAANLTGGQSDLRSGGAGRSFYTSLGHANETWNDAAFQAHVFGGIAWALQGSKIRRQDTAASSNGSSTPSAASDAGARNSAVTQASPALPALAALALMPLLLVLLQASI